jgi:hypothetical protein
LEDFTPFDSIPRLVRDVVVTEKIDGTNAQIVIGEDGSVRAGSRNRYITPEADNFGFARWVAEREEELRAVLGPGRHYGEWYGSGIQRGYGLSEKRFALFNTHRWTPAIGYLPTGIDVVPVLGIRTLDTKWIMEIADSLFVNGSRIAPGFAHPEGIVVFHTKSKQLYKYTFDKNDGHKGAA